MDHRLVGPGGEIISAIKTDDRAIHMRRRQEVIPAYREHAYGHRTQRQLDCIGTVILAARLGCHATSHLPLHHDRNACKGGKAGQVFQHQRSRYTIGKIRYELIWDMSLQVSSLQVQGILAYQEETVAQLSQRILQHIQQRRIPLHRYDEPGMLEQSMSERPYAGTHLQDRIRFAHLRQIKDTTDDAVVDEEILSEGLLGRQSETLQHGASCRGGCQGRELRHCRPFRAVEEPFHSASSRWLAAPMVLQGTGYQPPYSGTASASSKMTPASEMRPRQSRMLVRWNPHAPNDERRMPTSGSNP